jgi:hypothetical protein
LGNARVYELHVVLLLRKAAFDICPIYGTDFKPKSGELLGRMNVL